MEKSRTTGCRAAAAGAGFTLIELLVVVGIISILAAILFPVLLATQEKARRSVCASHLRQIGIAMQMYRQDEDGGWAPSLVNLYPAYITDRRLFVCPNDLWVGKGGAEGHFGYVNSPSAVQPQWPFPYSYRYLFEEFIMSSSGHYVPVVADPAWPLADSPYRFEDVPGAGYVACALHDPPQEAEANPVYDIPRFSGNALRLRFDGSVSFVHVHSPQREWGEKELMIK